MSERPGRTAAGAPAFVVAGVAGFAVDAGLTTALTALGAGPAPARAPAIVLALLATFALNRRYAFAPSGRGVAAEFARYVAVSAAGATISFGAYLLALAGLARLGAAPTLAAGLAVAVGSGAGMIANFLGYRGFAFAPAHPR